MATGRKTVVVGQVIDPVAWGNPLWDQSVQTFASNADRTAQFPGPKQGAVTWLEDVKRLDVFNGAAWVPVERNPPPDIQAAFVPAAGLWTAAENTLIRRFGWWHLHLYLFNANTGAFAAGAVQLGVAPPTARPSAGNYSVNYTAGFALLSGSGVPGVWPVQVTSADGVVVALNPAATASQPGGQFRFNLDMHWPDATIVSTFPGRTGEDEDDAP